MRRDRQYAFSLIRSTFFAATFGILVAPLGAKIETKQCEFSLKEQVPQNIKFTVQAGRVAFLCKSDTFFLRGTVTRTLPWQRTGKIFETMAERLKAETLESWAGGRLYKIAAGGESPSKTLICGYHTREAYSLDVCAPETDDKSKSDTRNLVGKFIKEFRTIALDAAPLLKSAPLFSQKKVFNEENETREPALLALTMPAGYVEVTRRENRALFTDAAGLAEIEVFYELSELALDSELAHKVYQKSIASFLARQGPWRADKNVSADKKDGVTCLIFTDNDKRLSHYCYAVQPFLQNAKKRFCRIAFVAVFQREAVDQQRFLADQQTILTEWMATIQKHSN